jgi:hypothetical protein
LEKKLEITGNILDGNKQNLEAENLPKGRIGRLSTPKRESQQMQTQKTILEWVSPKNNAIK